MNIYVGNLDFDVKDEELREIFEEYGTVDTIKIISDKYTGRSKGFGFVSIPDNSEANKAIKGLNGTTLGNREITVNEAKPKKDSFYN
ncbi:MAG: RNA-binding protein [Bacteroidetes bacterium]|nr:RNA-binding protein [Bacteroidota bacterium]